PSGAAEQTRPGGHHPARHAVQPSPPGPARRTACAQRQATARPNVDPVPDRPTATIGRLHNALGVTELVGETVASFHGRPYLVIHADRFVEVTERAIASDLVLRWPKRVRSVNQWADATDVLDRPSLLPQLRSVFPCFNGHLNGLIRNEIRLPGIQA